MISMLHNEKGLVCDKIVGLQYVEYGDTQVEWTDTVLGAVTSSRTCSRGPRVELTGRWKWHLSEGFSCKPRAPCPVFSILLVK